MFKVHASASSYTNTIYIVFDSKEYIDRYELYRDGVKIADSGFVRPFMFDHDHHTNLFRKESNHKLMYEDIDVAKFREYSYYVKYYSRENSWNSNTVYVTLQ